MNVPSRIQKVSQPGYIYLIRFVGLTSDCYKIGQTRDVRKRLLELQCFTCKKSILIAYGVSDDADYAERSIQYAFVKHSIGKEFFNFKVSMLDKVIFQMRRYCNQVHTDFSYIDEPIEYERLLPYHLDSVEDDDRDGYYAINRREGEMMQECYNWVDIEGVRC